MDSQVGQSLDGPSFHLSSKLCPCNSLVPYEAMEVPGKYRSGCLQSSIGWNTGSPVKELEKVPKELKGSATL